MNGAQMAWLSAFSGSMAQQLAARQRSQLYTDLAQKVSCEADRIMIG